MKNNNLDDFVNVYSFDYKQEDKKQSNSIYSKMISFFKILDKKLKCPSSGGLNYLTYDEKTAGPIPLHKRNVGPGI